MCLVIKRFSNCKQYLVILNSFRFKLCLFLSRGSQESTKTFSIESPPSGRCTLLSGFNSNIPKIHFSQRRSCQRGSCLGCVSTKQVVWDLNNQWSDITGVDSVCSGLVCSGVFGLGSSMRSDMEKLYYFSLSLSLSARRSLSTLVITVRVTFAAQVRLVLSDSRADACTRKLLAWPAGTD